MLWQANANAVVNAARGVRQRGISVGVIGGGAAAQTHCSTSENGRRVVRTEPACAKGSVVKEPLPNVT